MVLNSRYIFAVANHALLHGGLGYRPFFLQKYWFLETSSSFCSSFSVSYGNHLTLAFLLLVLAMLKCLPSSVTISIPSLPCEPSNIAFLTHTCPEIHLSEVPEVLDRRLRPVQARRLRPGRVSAVKGGVSGLPPETPALNPGDSGPMRSREYIRGLGVEGGPVPSSLHPRPQLLSTPPLPQDLHRRCLHAPGSAAPAAFLHPRIGDLLPTSWTPSWQTKVQFLSKLSLGCLLQIWTRNLASCCLLVLLPVFSLQ